MIITRSKFTIGDEDIKENHLSKAKVIYVLPTGDPTPDNISRGNLFLSNNTKEIEITNFIGGEVGQWILLIFGDDFTTLHHNSNIKLQGGRDFLGNKDDVMELLNIGSKWVETNRSLNS